MDKRRPSPWVWVAVVAVLLFVVYPLSVGPVVWLLWRVPAPEWMSHVVLPLYVPVGWLSGMSRTLGDVAAWYITLGIDPSSTPATPWIISP